MADVETPFLDRPTFEAMFRPLSAGERTLAERLLIAATRWIVDRRAEAGKPITVTPPDPMGFLVTFEVVKACFPTIPDLKGHTQYTITTDDRTQSGTLTDVAGLLDFDDRQMGLLGLSANPGPEYGGMDGDFGEPYPARRMGNVAAVVIGDLP